MTDLRQAAQQALEAIDLYQGNEHCEDAFLAAGDALRTALAMHQVSEFAQAQEQQAEPVFENLDYVAVVYSPSNAMLKSPLPIGTHLYKYPPQRQWVGLTDEDFLEACQIAERGNYLVAFQRIQTKLKERNT